MLAAARKRAATPKGKRDLALIRLMHDLGLRRGEVVTLDRADVDLEAGTVAIVGKGKSERMTVTLNTPAAAALADWVAARGEWPGPLFVRLDRAAGRARPGWTRATRRGSPRSWADGPGWPGGRTPTGCGTRGSRGRDGTDAKPTLVSTAQFRWCELLQLRPEMPLMFDCASSPVR